MYIYLTMCPKLKKFEDVMKCGFILQQKSCSKCKQETTGQLLTMTFLVSRPYLKGKRQAYDIFKNPVWVNTTNKRKQQL